MAITHIQSHWQWVGAVALLFLVGGCATTRVVHVDVGDGRQVVHESLDVDPVQVSEDEFMAALTQLILDMRMDVAFRETDAADQRGWVRSRALLASSKGLADPGSGSSPESLYARICPDGDDCLTLVGGTGLTFSRKDRTVMALSFALDTVWESVGAEVGKVLNPVVLKAMVTSAALTVLLTMTLPEPVTKVLAVALTAAMVAYLGIVPVWEIGRGFVHLWDEAETATSVIELQDIGHRFGKVLGTNGTRVLVLLVTAALGGKNAMAAQGPRLPGFSQAALRAQAEGGFGLAAAMNGGVGSISLPAAGVLNVALAPGATAAVALHSNGIPGDAKGPVHHICTNKNLVSAATGGPWTPLCERIFKKAGLTLEDAANKVRLNGHEGPHPELYHKKVVSRLQDAVSRCRTTETCRANLMKELAEIAVELTTQGSPLRRLIVKGGE
ncbi:AHH domain-containing protein [Corallococcus exiguus]|uniref:AHH domain-containing protein n=1 Tax=Corallococcus exiguus TaxID=83462 RepID=UPI001494F1F7|nr:AHH domain-containing protein [Corallococcus exiguus]NPC74802.1 AHH domain-containing protein [Corallococcus exiguus]NPD28755.1 AHH domain-containing protein [Corallococcus exiguus]